MWREMGAKGAEGDKSKGRRGKWEQRVRREMGARVQREMGAKDVEGDGGKGHGGG